MAIPCPIVTGEMVISAGYFSHWHVLYRTDVLESKPASHTDLKPIELTPHALPTTFYANAHFAMVYTAEKMFITHLS